MKIFKYKNQKVYTGYITELADNQVFCFGSNPLGINGNIKTNRGGAALHALKKGWVEDGEKMNNCLSKSGKSWGIVTIEYPGRKRSKTPLEISNNIKKLYNYAYSNKDIEFLIAYTGNEDGLNLNGYTNKAMSNMFSTHKIPNNIIFEQEFFFVSL
jgi:hypothetical protein